MTEAKEAAERLLKPMIYDGIKYLYDRDIQLVAAALLALLKKQAADDAGKDRCGSSASEPSA